MPATFAADSLRSSLRPLAAAQPLSEEARAYQHFYGLDLPQRSPPVVSRLGCFSSGAFELVSQLWLPAEPVATLFLLHGFYDHMGLFRHVVDWALDQGFAVLACDLPGHGLSSGERASIDDFGRYQQALQGLFSEARSLDLPQPKHGSGSPAQGQVILLSPLIRPRAWGWSKFSYYLLKPFVKGIARRFSENTNDPAFMPFLQADPLQPQRLPTAWVGALARWIPGIESAAKSPRRPLIVQGEADMTVDWTHNLDVLRAKFDHPEVLMLLGARHHLANEIPAYRERYFRFLSEHLQP
jgi:alpha-beta hydrolase superfamily lysophospholipase